MATTVTLMKSICLIEHLPKLREDVYILVSVIFSMKCWTPT